MRRGLLFSALVSLFFLAAAPAQQDADVFPRAVPHDGPIAVVGGMLIDGNEGLPIHDSVILIEDGRFTAVGTELDVNIPEGTKIIDANGFSVLPGLIEMHAHLMIVGHGIYPEFFPRYEDRMAEIMETSAKILLKHGVTTVRDVAGPLKESIELRERIRQGEIAGPRLFVSGPFISKGDAGLPHYFQLIARDAEEARKHARTLISAGVDLLKPWGGPTFDMLRVVAEEAHKAGPHVAAHGGYFEQISEVVRAGVDSIEHTGARGKAEFSEESIKVMAESGIYYDPTLMVSAVYDITTAFPERLDNQELKRYLPLDIYNDVRGSLRYFQRLTYFHNSKRDNPTFKRKLMQLYRAGIPIVVGTDSGTPMNFHHESTWQEMELMVKLGMHPLHVISSATRIPAQLLTKHRKRQALGGSAYEFGTVEPGKLADLIVVDGNPLENMRALKEIRHVIKEGVLYQ